MKAKEKQNQPQFENYEKDPVILGPYTSHMWKTDPKHIGFLLSRYKFVSKILHQKKIILEVGCGDSTGTPIVAKNAQKVFAVDFEPLLMEDNRKRLANYPNISFSVLDLTKSFFPKKYDAVFCLDVIEHIPPKLEDKFITNMIKNLDSDGICIIGTPNITAKAHASEASQKGHINLKSYTDFNKILEKYFKNGIVFSMNDEIVHTGFSPMAQYLMTVGFGKKK